MESLGPPLPNSLTCSTPADSLPAALDALPKWESSNRGNDTVATSLHTSPVARSRPVNACIVDHHYAVGLLRSMLDELAGTNRIGPGSRRIRELSGPKVRLRVV